MIAPTLQQQVSIEALKLDCQLLGGCIAGCSFIDEQPFLEWLGQEAFAQWLQDTEIVPSDLKNPKNVEQWEALKAYLRGSLEPGTSVLDLT